jgi:hypothetical protein
MSFALLLFVALGVWLAQLLIRHGSSLLDLLPRRRRALKCLRPYEPMRQYANQTDWASTHNSV